MKPLLFFILLFGQLAAAQTKDIIKSDTSWMTRRGDTVMIYRSINALIDWGDGIVNKPFWKSWAWSYIIKGDSLILIKADAVFTK